MAPRALRTLFLGALFCTLVLGSNVRAAAPVYGFRIVHTYRHDSSAFTEGLFYENGFLYESTGLEGHSSIRKVKLETGEVVEERFLDPKYFGEGIVAWKGRLVQLTWRSQTGFVYDLAKFTPVATFHYPGEGWALTRDDHRLIMSDGTSDIRFLNPETFAEIGRIHVTAAGEPLRNINELEWVKGEIYANVWETDHIARIDPTTGNVVGWIDLSSLPSNVASWDPDDVLNGIAYDAAQDRLFVTGKRWPQVYEIKLVPPGTGR